MYIPILFVFLLSSFPQTNLMAKENEFVVVIDAGHGGHDHGAIDNGTCEKDINLGVALKVGELIKKNLKNTKVVFTRSDDTFRTLQERADIANKAKGDLFISIHTNSVDKNNKNRTTVAGASVYALGLHKDANNMNVARRENSVIELENNHTTRYQGFDPNKDESYIIFEMAQKKNLSKSIRFANDVEKQVVKVAQRKDRGVHQAGFWVLWATSMPSVLVELDFICNPTSANFLASKEGQAKMAEAIYNAVKEYRNKEMATASVAPSPQQMQREIEAEQKRLAYKNDPSSAETGIIIGSEHISPHHQIIGDYRKNNEYNDTEPGIPVLLSNATTSPERVIRSSSDTRNQTANTLRRRRPESGKAASGRREIETSEIPLHHDDERLAKSEETSVEESLNPPVKIEDENTEGSKADKKHNLTNKDKRNLSESKKDRRNTGRMRGKAQHLTSVYYIQLLSSSEKLKPDNQAFKGLKPVKWFQEHGLYKYTYGETSDKKEIEDMLQKVKEDFPKAFIIERKK
ncbi:MAG: N-acetylmuramoyl-L-alanine amidase [Muribaculaceae bacterium]|nr:N-acetylmuramoyl-L-alanine amidase [Muribaculaceae bacterium]